MVINLPQSEGGGEDMGMKREITFFSVFMLLAGMALLAGTGIAQAEESKAAADPPRSQWEAIKRGMLNNFRLNVGFTYGFAYSDALALPTKGEFDDVFDQLGLTQSTNVVLFDTLAQYTYTPKTDWSLPDFLDQPNLGFYLYFPFGVVQDISGRTLPGLVDFDDMKFAVGDIYFGINSWILRETRWIPHTNFSIQATAPAAEYSSIGSGTWSVKPNLYLEKYLTDRFFLTFDVAYLFFAEKNGVEWGNPLILKGGPGFLFLSGQLKTVLGVAYSKRSETKLFGMPLETDTDNLTLALSFSEPTDKFGFYFYFTGIDEGFDIERNTFGFNFSLRVFPWRNQR